MTKIADGMPAYVIKKPAAIGDNSKQDKSTPLMPAQATTISASQSHRAKDMMQAGCVP